MFWGQAISWNLNNRCTIKPVVGIQNCCRQKEVPILSHLVGKIETKSRRLYHCFWGTAIQWDWLCCWQTKPEVGNWRWRPLNFNIGRHLEFSTSGLVDHYSNHSHSIYGPRKHRFIAVEISFLSCLHFAVWFSTSDQVRQHSQHQLDTVYWSISNTVYLLLYSIHCLRQKSEGGWYPPPRFVIHVIKKSRFVFV